MALADGLLVPALIIGGIGLFLVAAGLREAYFAVRLWRIRPVPIGELGRASGTVTVAGEAERIDETLRAPLTGTECLGYAWRVLGVRTTRGFDGRIEQSFHQLATGREAVRFRLGDHSGSVVVDPRGGDAAAERGVDRRPGVRPRRARRDLARGDRARRSPPVLRGADRRRRDGRRPGDRSPRRGPAPRRRADRRPAVGARDVHRRHRTEPGTAPDGRRSGALAGARARRARRPGGARRRDPPVSSDRADGAIHGRTGGTPSRFAS